MKYFSLVTLFLGFITAACAQANVYCADEPGAKAFLQTVPETFSAMAFTASDHLFDSWLETLSLKTRLPLKDDSLTPDKYVEEKVAPRPIPGWDGGPVQFSCVIALAGDGRPIAVVILAASDRALAKAYCANYLSWKFKRTLARQELKPGIYKEVPVLTFFYVRQVFARDPEKSSSTPPPMQVFAKIIN